MRLLISAFLLLSLAAYAEALSIPIPGQGWTLEMQAPPIIHKNESSEDGTFSFLANGKSFNLFIFVNPPAKDDGSNRDCFDFYWSKASGNPRIDKNSIETTSNARYHRVQYTTLLKAGSKTLTSTHVNYYFVFAGKWVEVDITISNPTAKDSEIIEAFDKGLSYAKK